MQEKQEKKKYFNKFVANFNCNQLESAISYGKQYLKSYLSEELVLRASSSYNFHTANYSNVSLSLTDVFYFTCEMVPL